VLSQVSLNPERENRMLKSLGPALVLGMALVNPVSAQTATRFDGQYVGELKLTRVIGGDCTQPPPGALYPLTISAGRVLFKYDPRFDTVLRGNVAENGTFSAFRVLPKGVISMTGRIHQGNITALIRSPSCNYTFRTRS
jgi:hypothetical protein